MDTETERLLAATKAICEARLEMAKAKVATAQAMIEYLAADHGRIRHDESTTSTEEYRRTCRLVLEGVGLLNRAARGLRKLQPSDHPFPVDMKSMAEANAYAAECVNLLPLAARLRLWPLVR